MLDQRTSPDEYVTADFGWPLWTVRSTAARALLAVAFAVARLSLRLYHPDHPYRIFTVGALEMAERGRGAATVPTRFDHSTFGDKIRGSLYLAVGAVGVGFLFAVVVAAAS